MRRVTFNHLDIGVVCSAHGRDPYLDPLNNIQITLLSRYRNDDLARDVRERWLPPLLRSINAIASGMRNTG